MSNVPKQRTKVVVRRLPPGLTEEALKATIDKLLPESQYTWFSYFQGKASMRKTVLSRAYLNFSDPEAVYDFKAKFDGHAFITNKGSQFKCAVEYAPFQKVPNPPKKRNPLEGTIDQDPHYQAFLKSLESGPELLPSAAAQREQQEKAAAAAGGAGPDTSVKVTPLMEYLRNKYLNNPGLRMGDVRRNKGKAGALPPVAAKPTKVSGKAGAAQPRGAPAKPGSEVAAPAAAKAVTQDGASAGKGGKQQQQQQQGKGLAAVQAMASQQQQQKQQQKGGPAQAAPKLVPRPQQQGSHTQPVSRPATAQAQQQSLSNDKPVSARVQQLQDSKGSREGHRGVLQGGGGTAASAGASTVATAAPVKLMAKPAAPSRGAAAGGVNAAAAQASTADGGAGVPDAGSRPASAVAPVPSAAPANGTESTGDAPAAGPRPERVRRVRAGFQSYQPKRRGGDEDE